MTDQNILVGFDELKLVNWYRTKFAYSGNLGNEQQWEEVVSKANST